MSKWGAAMLGAFCLLVNGCSPAPPPPVQLTSDQTLRLIAARDVDTLDPAKIHEPSVGYSLARNVFGGLYQFNKDLTEIPDLATRMPEISADGLTWTFHVRPNARFSNGDSVKAGDVVYSWNRVAALTDYQSSSIFEPVVGYLDIANGRSQTLSGLAAPDDHTVVARLTAPAGWWLTELGILPTAVIDQKVVLHNGEDTWWQRPDGLIGTGPFHMTQRIEGRSLDFAPVDGWWRGNPGFLKRVHVDVITDRAAAATAYVAGDYDVVGYVPDSFPADPQEVRDAEIKRLGQSGEVQVRPWIATVNLAFPRAGRLGRDTDVEGRGGLSLALDRSVLAGKSCMEGSVCAPATGGLILKGLAGYLGDGSDPFAKHDLSAAKRLLASWDPGGSRLKGVLRVGAISNFKSLADGVKAQWQADLGLDVQLEVADFDVLRLNAIRGLYDVSITTIYADYDSPHNWLADLVNQKPFCRFGDTQFRNLLEAADRKLAGDALAQYLAAGSLLAGAAACPALVYLEGVYLIKPWVKGAGGNALYEYDWTGIKILKH